MRRTIVIALLLALAAVACGGGGEPAAEVAPSTAPPAGEPTTTTIQLDEETTTTTAFARLIDIHIEPPPQEELTLTAEDGTELYARWWPGNGIGVLFGHDFDNPTPGAAGQRAPQSSEGLLWASGALAREGYSVLAPDLRGHGQSSGEFDVRRGPADLKAAYEFLQAQQVDHIVMIGWVGSGTAAVVLDAADDGVAFDGIMLLFSPPQDTGLDAQAVIGELDIPTSYIAVDTGPSARFVKLLERRAADSRGLYVFEPAPTGVTFIDVYGEELVGRIADFIDLVAAEG